MITLTLIASRTGRGDAHKRERERVVDVTMRKGVWNRFGKQEFPHLWKVAVRLLSILPTSSASVCNWSLWGRVYTAARNRLGLERAKNLILVCFNDRARVVDQSDFRLLLSVVEGEFSRESAIDNRPL
jgi:hAT family C-terminal dimerisation region